LISLERVLSAGCCYFVAGQVLSSGAKLLAAGFAAVEVVGSPVDSDNSFIMFTGGLFAKVAEAYFKVQHCLQNFASYFTGTALLVLLLYFKDSDSYFSL
jgi:hypothetical protein